MNEMEQKVAYEHLKRIPDLLELIVKTCVLVFRCRSLSCYMYRLRGYTIP